MPLRNRLNPLNRRYVLHTCMQIDTLKILVPALVQGAAELLPVSSSAHVIVAEKLMGLDPTAPAMTLLLVMLHTGTMFAVIVYFRNDWRKACFFLAAGDGTQRGATDLCHCGHRHRGPGAAGSDLASGCTQRTGFRDRAPVWQHLSDGCRTGCPAGWKADAGLSSAAVAWLPRW